MAQKMGKERKIFLAYLDERDNLRMGNFELIKETESYIKVRSDRNIITIPFHRIKKMKEHIE